MRKLRLGTVIALVVSCVGFGQRRGSDLPEKYAYSPAFISTTISPGHTLLLVFPFHGKSFEIAIHEVVPLQYSFDGTALFGACSRPPADPNSDERPRIAQCKIDLRSGTTTEVPVSNPSGIRSDDSVSRNREDYVLFSGVDPKLRRGSGLFLLNRANGKVRTLLWQADETLRSRWQNLSLSPDNQRAVATHQGRVELIDVARGSAETLAGDFLAAAWSPDGKWLAAVEKGEKHTILMDAKTLTRRRILGPSELDWSPDSRYLLGLKSCHAYYGTLEAINVETGERSPIKSSRCKVNQARTGWVSSDLTGDKLR